jgi:ATP-binding cassette subfamily G (WHITE) protein 2
MERQDDQLMGVLTVRENFMFSAELRLPKAIKKSEKKTRVEDTIELLVGRWVI